MKQVKKVRHKNWRFTLLGLVLAPLVAFTAAQAVAFAADIQHQALINSNEYKALYGKWDKVVLPEDLQVNAIHSALLPTGKVLLIAGSGNDRKQFDAGTFSTLVYDPVSGTAKLVDTPEDLFCAGHAFLPNGNLLVAGGTQGYEILPENLSHAGGYVTLRNENPDKEFTLSKDTEIVGAKSGATYRIDSDITIPPAKKDPVTYEVSPTDRNVYASATEAGASGVWEENETYAVKGLTGEDVNNLHGFGPKMSMEKKEYQGIDSAYEFDPKTERYIKVDAMNYARWYPTLTSMPNGHVLALSGLDGSGQILDGQTEVYDPSTQQWTERDDLRRFFPTYPSVFQTSKPGVLFSAGPSTGWGAAEQGRDPGFWHHVDNSFEVVSGLRDPLLLETGAAGWLGPVNDQRMIVVGGGGIGDSNESTGRVDVIDLDSVETKFAPLADLPQGTRYPNLVTLPTGDVFITNGAGDYRGRSKSDILKSFVLEYKTGALRSMADPTIGRNYHTSALLLPNGQIMVAGSDPLFADKENLIPGTFEKTIEIYSPPYLFTENGGAVARPVLTGGPGSMLYGQAVEFSVENSDPVLPLKISHVRLAYPGAVTHSTDTNQKLVELDFVQTANGIKATLPDNPALAPPGHYMLFLVNDRGVPSVAEWVQVGDTAGVDAAVDIQKVESQTSSNADGAPSVHNH